MFGQLAGCKGDHSTKLAHQQAKMLQICKPSPYIFSRILGPHLHIHYPSRNLFTYCPSPGTCLVHSRGLPLVVVGMKSEVFLAKARCLYSAFNLVKAIHFFYCSFLCVYTADHEMWRCPPSSLVSKASLFNPYMFKP